MKVRATLSSLLCAMLPLAPMALAPLPALAQHHARDGLPTPAIRGFNVEEVPRIAPGVELHFDLYGTPGGNATVKIDGATRNLRLTETDPGQYVGTYTVGTHDRIRNDSRASADLRLGTQFASTTLRETLVRDGAPPVARRELTAAQGAGTAPGREPKTARYCTNCATVESVNVVREQGQNSMLGTAGGAVVGGLLGNQVGSGSGRTAATVAGAVGGAMAGRAIERNARGNERYEVVVRYSGNGATQTLQYDNDPGFRPGDAVRVNDGVLSRDQ